MRKNLLSSMLIFIAFIAVLVGSQSAFGCSSFAVYANKPFYGMNFDYEKFPIKFAIVEKDGLKSFHLSFERPVAENKKIWVNTGGMNSNGLFAALQEEHPYQKNPPEPGENDIYVHQLYETLFTSQNAQAIERICNEKRLVQLKAVSIHSLFADINGQAFVAEAGESGTILTKMKSTFIVMTNFPNRSLAGKHYKEAEGPGNDRYIAGYDYLKDNADSFTMEKGMHVLELMKNKDPEYPTNCSMVFDPTEKTIYISLFTDYQKIFKVTLADSTISTFKGFPKSVSLKADQNGISLSTLAAL